MRSTINMRAIAVATLCAYLGSFVASQPAFAQPGSGTGGGQVVVPTGQPQSTATSPPRRQLKKPGDPVADIPKSTTTPPTLFRATPEDRFGCRRQLLYRGNIVDCDSNARQDAQHLRDIVASVPDAAAEIDAYQKNRRLVRRAAYVATAGILLTGVFMLIAGQHKNDNGNLSLDGIAIRNIGVAIGGGMAVGSLLYGFSLIKTNEAHIDRAVELYNQAKPQDAIELRFTTGLSF